MLLHDAMLGVAEQSSCDNALRVHRFRGVISIGQGLAHISPHPRGLSPGALLWWT